MKIKEIKQRKAMEDNKNQLVNIELLLLKQREIFKNICIKRLNKIDEVSKKIGCGDLKFILTVLI